jgi:TonB-linked SusC/RagA family outer membrane protein
MNKLLFYFKVICFVLCSSYSVAQQTITGTVTTIDGPLPGASVVVKGTTNGTTTDFDGNFTIQAAQGDVLTASFVGFTSKELIVGDSLTIEFSLEEGEALSEVVVTALGISRDKKSLGYSVTQVDGDEINQVKSTKPFDALRGKIAGVNISNNASGVKGSTRVVIRGNSSFNGSNQPLYVVDGISIQNEQLGSAGEWGGVDNGDGLSALNPDDIKSISVLKGGAAAALYGSRASNGVILITTKNGSEAKKGLGIEYSNQTTFTSINKFFDPQSSYGNGLLGVASTDLLDPFNSWGPKLSSSEKVYDNLAAIYDTGLNTINTLAFTSNNNKGSTRLSMTRTNAEDVIDTSKLKRNSLSLSSVQNLSDKLSVSSSLKYSESKEFGNVIMATAPFSPNGVIRDFAPNIDVNDFRGEYGDGTSDGQLEAPVSSNIFNTNPWFAKYNNITSSYKDRLLGSLIINYDINEFLYVKGQTGMDRATNHFNNNILNGAPLFMPGVAYNNAGNLYEQTQTIKQYDADFLVGSNKVSVLDELSFNGFVGLGTSSFEAEAIGAEGSSTVIPGLYTLKNTQSQTALYNFSERKINSVYGSAELSFQDKIFLSATARNDWFSTLSLEGKEAANNDLYGSASLAVILSDLIEMPSFVSFAKLRGGVSQVAGGAESPYSLSLTYALNGSHQGNSLGNVNGSNIPNKSITPFQKDENEIGLNLILFGNKLDVDFSYYSNSTKGDIVDATTSKASGYDTTSINLGEMTNKGVEILVNSRVIEKPDLSLDLSFNYANNKSNVVKTDENGNTLQLGWGSLFNSYIGAIEGEPYGVLYGTSYVRDENGNVVHSLINGIPTPKVENVSKVLGVGVAPTQVGFGIDFGYKNFSLGLFLEGKFGGTILSDTNGQMKLYGLHQDTVPAGGREAGFTPNGVMEDGSAMPTISAEDLQYYWTSTNGAGNGAYDVGEENAYKNDFVRISQLAITYNVPQNLIEKTFIKSAQLSLIGNNLGFLIKDVPNIDPEPYYNTSNAQGIERIGMPVGQSVGFSVNIKI